MTNTNAHTIWTVSTASGNICWVGDREEFRATSQDGEMFTDKVRADVAYGSAFQTLPRTWKTENDCSNGRFAMNGGACSVTLTEHVIEYDEDAEDWIYLSSDVLAMDIWDGEKLRHDLLRY